MRALAALLCPLLLPAVELPDGVSFKNNVVIVRGKVLLTHARRDILATGRDIVAPASERELFEHPERFWADLEKSRFHDYAQKSTKVPVRPVRVTHAVSDGDVLDGAPRIRVIATPGYTRGAVTYLIEAGAKRIACTGDLVYGDGQIFDLYTLQDAVPEAKARGYHGYAARAVDLIASLRKVAALKPDLILPARGLAITDPQAAIGKLIDRVQRFLASHFETDALRWYWGDDNHRIRSRAVERKLDVMPMAEQAKLPEDIVAIGNSRLLLSRSGAAFLVDAGYSRILADLERLRGEGRFTKLDGMWITHYHDDHTDRINDVVKAFAAPVYFTDRMAEVLAKPGSFRLPCLTTNPVPVSGARRDDDTMRWHEWMLRFWYFPGQTLYHGGLLATHDDGRSYLFTGDSFTPSGMDDYCMQNRVFLRSGEGYDFCFRKIATLPKGTWLINQHVEPTFRYTEAQIRRMRSELDKRSAVLRELSPWPDINYMVDESWARVHPYGSQATAGESLDLELRILNHSPRRTQYKVKWNVPAGWTILNAAGSVAIEPRKEGRIQARVRAGSPGLYVITADVAFDGRELREWTEAIVRVP